MIFPGIHSDIVCKYQEATTMYAFAFRTHAHGLGKVYRKIIFLGKNIH